VTKVITWTVSGMPSSPVINCTSRIEKAVPPVARTGVSTRRSAVELRRQ
jgi:hypothetical protein